MNFLEAAPQCKRGSLFCFLMCAAYGKVGCGGGGEGADNGTVNLLGEAGLTPLHNPAKPSLFKKKGKRKPASA